MNVSLIKVNQLIKMYQKMVSSPIYINVSTQITNPTYINDGVSLILLLNIGDTLDFI